MTRAVNGTNGESPATVTDRRATALKKGRLIGHREAFTFLFSRMASESLTEEVRTELPAIISHWLHSPSSDPLFLGATYAPKWRSELAARAHISLDRFARIKSQRGTPKSEFHI